MPNTGQVHWHEGLFLQPHHLQALQHWISDGSIAAHKLNFPYPYGVIEMKISPDGLENQLVRFDKLRVIMPSGVEVVVGENCDLPALDIKKAFSQGAGSFNVLLGVPLWYNNRANSIELGANADWRTKRIFRAEESTEPDENTGENPQSIVRRRINARLILQEDDPTDLEVMPLIRIAHAAGADVGLPRQDSSYIPPCFTLAGSTSLRELCRDLANQIEASRKELVLQLSRGGFSIETMRGIQFEQMMRLRTLNRFAGSLPSLVMAPNVTPFEVYLELRQCLGELAALHPDRDPFEAAAYDHDNPAIAFSELTQKIRSLLRGAVAARFLKVDFTRDNGLYAATLTDEHLSAPSDYYLAIQTKDDAKSVASLVENADQFKFMAKTLAAQRIWGVKLTEERHPPLELPSKAGLYYFRLNRGESQRMWDRIKEEKSVAIRWPDAATSEWQLTLYMTVS
jgi:type VI secretion system ImpJ/VasE family protein